MELIPFEQLLVIERISTKEIFYLYRDDMINMLYGFWAKTYYIDYKTNQTNGMFRIMFIKKDSRFRKHWPVGAGDIYLSGIRTRPLTPEEILELRLEIYHRTGNIVRWDNV
jgi:hypothetical protein